MKKTILLFLFCLIIIGINAQSPTFEWAKQLSGPSYDKGHSIAVDKVGNIYTLIWFQGTIDLDPGSGIFNITSTGSFDIGLSKLDNNGNFLWGKQFGAQGTDVGSSIALDSLSNVYTIGSFNNTVDFDPGIGVSNLSASSNSADIFISKLDKNGDFMWVKQILSTQGSSGRYITLDSASNIYITGLFQGTADFDPGIMTNTLVSSGYTDIFVSKLNRDGDFVWAKKIGGDSLDYGTSIALDKLGNIYITGWFQDTVDFDPNTGVFNLTSHGSDDIFISKFNNSGDFIWAKGFGNTLSERANSIKVDGLGNVYIASSFQGNVDFNPGIGIFNMSSMGNNDIFISKLDSGGNFVWAKQIGDVNNDFGYAIAIDEYENTYITGSFWGNVDFDPNIGTFYLTSSTGSGFFLKLDVSGNLIWAKQIGGVGSSIVLDTYNNIYTTGMFSGSFDFDPSANVFNLTSFGSLDTYVHKMSQQTSVNLNKDSITSIIKIYPNPNNGKLNLIISNQKFKNLKFEIYNCLGELVLKNIIENEKNSIDLTNQVDGIYFIKVISDNSPLFYQKILKQ